MTDVVQQIAVRGKLRDVAEFDPRDPDHSRSGIFVLHDCWRCKDGKKPCVNGDPNRCDNPHARND